MKIYPVNFSNNYQVNTKQKASPVQNPIVKSGNIEALYPVSFTSTAPNAEVLRLLFKYNIHDFYSPIILLDPDAATDIFKSRVFSSALSNISKVLFKHHASLFDVEQKMYGLILRKAKIDPNMALDKYIKEELFPKHNQILKDIQRPVFKRLEGLSSDFPADLLEQFNYLMYVTEQKIEGQEIFIPFSVKEFRYKLNRIRSRIGAAYDTEEGKAMNKLINIAASVPYTPKQIRLSPNFKIRKYEDKQKEMVDKFTSCFQHSVLKDDADLQALAELANMRVLKVPTLIPFSRKTFLYDLERITERLSDTHLAHMVTKEAIKLPTSKQNLSAFIVKSADRSSEQIGYDMLNGSIGNIDHFVASHNDGLDNIYNYVLSSSYMNSLKAHKRFAVFFNEYPDIAIYAQRQIDDLIMLAHSGVFREIGLSKSYITNLVKKAEKLSKKKNNPPLILDASRL